jgi:ABC-type lipoprotein release transport system permease subunit
MSLATTLLIVVLGINDGFLWSMIISATEYYHGHIRITDAAYSKEHDLHSTMSSKELPFKAEKIPDSFQATGRLRGFGLLSHEMTKSSNITVAAELLGVQPDKEKLVTKFHESLIKGAWFSQKISSTNPIILGKSLAKRLKVNLGDELVFMGQGAYGSIASAIFSVTGILETGDNIRDGQLALLPLSQMQSIMELPEQLHEWIIKIEDPLEPEIPASHIKSSLDTNVYKVATWKEILPQISQILELWTVTQVIILFIFYFAVILITFNTMAMAIIERAKELAVIRAMGLTRCTLLFMLCLEGLTLSSIAALIGGICGASLSFFFHSFPVDLSFTMTEVRVASTTFAPMLRTYPDTVNILFPVLAMMALGPFTSIPPAWKLLNKPLATILGER